MDLMRIRRPARSQLTDPLTDSKAELSRSATCRQLAGHQLRPLDGPQSQVRRTRSRDGQRLGGHPELLKQFFGPRGFGNELNCFQSPTALTGQNVEIIGPFQQGSPIYSRWVERDAGCQLG
jgi:hypothetical protein